ncbi:hypothetical protein Vretimale_1095 [Volvox reticuliferus]|uniref:Uncharacterized protein n=1 Tax=Volvox reticuliferus TaxID=1737510 RepID=A0A8J4CHT3_9CHLO|nr:hypothetical protein Vretifemale_10317 [Volvox reticuliferus]GIL95070.1 hypothetical protein Vretimale_1095 [Volvox reticuliferus]
MRPAVKGDWSTGLCECCAAPGGCGTCCYAYCCPCCQYGQNIGRMPAGEVCCGGNCCGACCCYFILMELGLCCFLHCGARSWLRKKYSIPGDPCQDCCTALCCAPCAMCQEHRELTIRSQTETVPHNKVVPSGAAAPPVMVMTAPPPAAAPVPYAPPPQAYAPPPQQPYAPPPPAYAPPMAYPPPQQAYMATAPPPPAYQQPYPQPVYVQAQQGYGGKHNRRGSSSSDD